MFIYFAIFLICSMNGSGKRTRACGKRLDGSVDEWAAADISFCLF